jgi:tetratricopeptide (TPR) repeat protein
LYERALAIWEKQLGPDHPDTATSLNNLAGLLQAQGDFGGARPLYERALAIREKQLGPDHPATAASLNNLAGG